jgi:hypothetical protein
VYISPCGRRLTNRPHSLKRNRLAERARSPIMRPSRLQPGRWLATCLHGSHLSTSLGRHSKPTFGLTRAEAGAGIVHSPETATTNPLLNGLSRCSPNMRLASTSASTVGGHHQQVSCPGHHARQHSAMYERYLYQVATEAASLGCRFFRWRIALRSPRTRPWLLVGLRCHRFACGFWPSCSLLTGTLPHGSPITFGMRPRSSPMGPKVGGDGQQGLVVVDCNVAGLDLIPAEGLDGVQSGCAGGG